MRMVEHENENNRKKRRLPVWMAAIGTADEPRKSEDEVNGRSTMSQALKPKAKIFKENALASDKTLKRPRRSRKIDIGTSTVAKKKRSTKKTQKIHEDEEQPTREVTTLKSKDIKVDDQHCEEELDLSLDEDQTENVVELTVDDLIDIAREYISAHDKKEQELSSQEPTLRTHTDRISNGPSTKTTLSKCTTTASLSNSCQLDKQGKERTEQENIFTDFTKTGDAAQDMLDLFLGPLLKTIDTKNRQVEVITSEDVCFGDEFVDRGRDEAPRIVEVPVEKRKSSLRDKVAMFLD